MSSPASLYQELISTYVALSAYVLFFFESCITFSQEIHVIWNRKWTMMTWIFALARYSTVLSCVLTFVPVSSLKDCKIVQYIDSITALADDIGAACFSALRVHALLDGRASILVSGAVFSLSLVPFAVNIYNFATSTVFYNPEVCMSLRNASKSLSLRLSLGTRVAVVVSNVLVLAVTWFKTAELYKEARQLKIKAPLATLLLRDGATVNVFTILAVNVPLRVVEHTIPTLAAMQISSPFLIIIPPMVICRFILNLRQIEPAGSSWASGNKSISLRFVGNMGESLQFGNRDEIGGDERYNDSDGSLA
ncbi:hypothetical protein BC629DRAFT_1442216 [Irpex lacteus]|nr:hypothetical protein BC629DRAFT_1442216 [Irpex lacteus]